MDEADKEVTELSEEETSKSEKLMTHINELIERRADLDEKWIEVYRMIKGEQWFDDAGVITSNVISLIA